MTDDTQPLQLSDARFTVEYRVSGTEAEARAKAALIGIDQTIEAPVAILPSGRAMEQILGRVERFAGADTHHYEVIVSYPLDLLGNTCAQLLNTVFGMSSLKAGIRVLRLHLSDPALQKTGFSGPRFGREGLRRLVGIPRRPLVCGVLKPLGLSPTALADLAYQFALGGVDLVKDDQSLADHPFCPFDERVARCAEAVARANRETGQHCLYLAHVTGPWETMRHRCRLAKQAGAGGLLICPGLVGFDALRDIARDDSLALPILSHPALLGSFIVPAESGMAPAVVFGQLPRLAGADASLYPIYHAGFPVTRDDCRATATVCGDAWGNLKPIFPTAAGRMGFERVLEMCEFYGPDVLFILGSSIQQHRAGLVKACRMFMDEVACRAQQAAKA